MLISKNNMRMYVNDDDGFECEYVCLLPYKHRYIALQV